MTRMVMMTEKREILVIEISTNEIVKRVDVTGRSEQHIELCMLGMLRNMNQNDYRIEDTDWGKEG